MAAFFQDSFQAVRAKLSSNTVQTQTLQSVVTVINQLQDVFSALGCSAGECINLPQIVVVGSQSSGKSSVLENIVGKDFLPRGLNMVTRCPTYLQLLQTASGQEEYAEFLHEPKKKYTDFAMVKAEIARRTNELCEPDDITDTPITLKIYSPNLPTLTLVDLPGIIETTVHGQNKDMVDKIKNLVRSYAEKPNAIILVVAHADCDINATSSLGFARQIDPSLSRTMVVLTKMDLINPGAENRVRQVLLGKTLPTAFGYIGVINRTQTEIDEKLPIQTALENELTKFRTETKLAAFKDLANVGTLALIAKLTEILVSLVRDSVPHLRLEIESKKTALEQEKESLGPGPGAPRDEQHSLLNRLLRDFCDKFQMALLGNSTRMTLPAVTPNEGPEESARTFLEPGATIGNIFRREFPESLCAVVPLTNRKDEELTLALLSAQGIRSNLFLSQSGFDAIVTPEIERLKAPVLQCAALVLNELRSAGAKAACPIQFHVLRQRFLSEFSTYLEELSLVLDVFLRNLVNMEKAYIDTQNPEFVRRVTAEPSLRAGVDVLGQADLGGCVQDYVPSKGPVRVTHPAKEQTSFWRSWRRDSDSAGTPSPQLADDIQPKVNLSTRDREQLNYMKTLVTNYLDVVRNSIRENVPKAITLMLINSILAGIQSRLSSRVVNHDPFDKLLEEDDAKKERRKIIAKLLPAYQKAREILDDRTIDQRLR